MEVENTVAENVMEKKMRRQTETKKEPIREGQIVFLA